MQSNNKDKISVDEQFSKIQDKRIMSDNKFSDSKNKGSLMNNHRNMKY